MIIYEVSSGFLEMDLAFQTMQTKDRLTGKQVGLCARQFNN